MKADRTLHLIAVLKAAVQLYVVLQPGAEKKLHDYCEAHHYKSGLEKRCTSRRSALLCQRGTSQEVIRRKRGAGLFEADIGLRSHRLHAMPTHPPRPSTLFECRLQ